MSKSRPSTSPSSCIPFKSCWRYPTIISASLYHSHPTRGRCFACALDLIGHAAAAEPTSVTNCRRLMDFPSWPRLHPTTFSADQGVGSTALPLILVKQLWQLRDIYGLASRYNYLEVCEPMEVTVKLRLLFTSALFLFGQTATMHAQETVDVPKITCQQILKEDL